MKLRLNHEQGLAILDVLEEVDNRGIEALKAGLSVILKDSRKRILVDLTKAKSIDSSVASELLKLVALAAGLGGQLAFIGQGDHIRAALSAAPPASGLPVRVFSSKTAAVSVLTEPVTAMVDFGLAGDPNGQLKTKQAELAAENEKLKTRASAVGDGAQLAELKALRKSNGRLTVEIAAMNEQLAGLAKQKSPVHASLLLDRKIEALERVLVYLLGQEGLIGGQPGAAP